MTAEYWLLSLVPALLLFLLAWGARRLFASWLAPSAFFALYWGVGLLAPLVLAPDYYFWPGAAWLILFSAWVFHVGTVTGWAFGSHSGKALVHSVRLRSFQFLWGKQVLIIVTGIGLLTIPIILVSREYSVTALMHPELVACIARDFSVARYSEGYDPPLIARILLSFLYAGGFLGGAWWAVNNSNRTRIWALLPFLPLALIALISTSRNYIFFPLVFLIGTYLATSVLKQKRLHIITWRRIYWGGLSIVMLVFIFVGLQILRDDVNRIDNEGLLRKARSTAMGSPAAFSQWLEREWDYSEPTLGAYSLAGFFDWPGIANRLQGLYSENVHLGKDQAKGEITNVYTAFRGLIQDFTLPGSIVVLFVFGAITGFAHHRSVSGRSSFLPLLSICYVIILWGYFVSVLNYNSIVMSWLIFCLCISEFGLRLLRRKSLHSKPKKSKNSWLYRETAGFKE